MKEYAVYKGDDLVVFGTAEQCANELGVAKSYIQWLTTNAYKRRLATRKNPEKCLVCIRIDDEDEQLEVSENVKQNGTGW